MTSPINFKVSVLLLREGESWVAQCLDYDIAAQGRSLSEVKERFAKTFIGQILVDLHHNVVPLSGFSQAPDAYWKHYQN